MFSLLFFLFFASFADMIEKKIMSILSEVSRIVRKLFLIFLRILHLFLAVPMLIIIFHITSLHTSEYDLVIVMSRIITEQQRT